MTLLDKITAYMTEKNYVIFTNPGELNIVYIEGVNADGSDNDDAADKWNDRRIVFDYPDGQTPRMLHNSPCTTEPGKAPTFSLRAMKRGGVFRIAFGQYLEAWIMDFHKGNPNHPALVQAPECWIVGYRDKNKDGKRTGDTTYKTKGINQHGTRPGFFGFSVGFFSEGCLVGRLWTAHMAFMYLVRSDIRYLENKKFRFTSTVIAGDKMNEMFV